jgi:hypothetical protein
MKRSVLGLAFVSVWLMGAATGRSQPIGNIEFNRDIRPILSDTCFVCHGPDNNLRKADLRLDREQDALADRDGHRVIVPGEPAASELYRRISASDPSKRMPPRKHNKHLTQTQIELIRRWIEQGGKYQKHWSLIAAKKPELPEVKNTAWLRNAIDRFTLVRMERERLSPAAEADRRTLIRRLCFDLTGLPPAPGQVDAFLADHDPRAYEKLVERVLRSPHFGERMAMYWLDQVRFADTAGYHSDNPRDLYLYRDYIIAAFNGNMPFDRFTIEQLAGDLLPAATREQRIASGYNRLLQTTEEGGAQAKEYTAKYAADRVRNTSSVWMGLTLGCAECHDHKFDPVTTKEFYRFEAFFADINERAVGRQDQTPMPSTEQAERLKKLEAEIAPLQKLLNTSTPQLDAEQRQWELTVKAKTPAGLPKNIAGILSIPADKRDARQKQDLAGYYRGRVAPGLKDTNARLAHLLKQKADFTVRIPTTLVAMAVPPRIVRVLKRGNWLDDSGDIVVAGVPASLPPLKVDKNRATRLDLARWLVAPENPLTARVFVNRLWLLMFGQGLVKTADDFGSQGAWPTHPELLDWLAVEFRASGWNVKHMLRLMALSATYRQSSQAGEKLRQHDPYNQFLARQSAFRIDAELVRDNALAVSGLLSRKIGGPSVKPYQPAGYWQYLNFPTRTWVADKGESQYRRGLYTFWQRTFLHPSLRAFDAPSREECAVDRPRSNTPLQALVLLNDPTYVEAARTLAERAFRAGKDTPSRIEFAYRQVLTRQAQPEELKLLENLYDKHLADYRKDTNAAAALLRVGDCPAPADIPAAELAAWTSVTRVILNLHETITRS